MKTTKKKFLYICQISVCFFNSIQSQTVSTFAGNGTAGSIDGTATIASFDKPTSLCADALGNVYVADFLNHKIRKITPIGIVTTFAGSGSNGSIDATGTAASFYGPAGICCDASGNIYVADYSNHKIRKITPSGVVTTFAGSGSSGSVDGSGATASFKGPTSVCLDMSGNIYVGDVIDHKIRKITPSGIVSTLAGTGTAGFADATGTSASFNQPSGLCSDASSNIYVADFGNQKIRKITPSSVVTTLAGSGVIGSTDGIGTAASFNYPIGVFSDLSGAIYVADYNNHKIRKITSLGVVTTLAGSGVIGSTDGIGTAASFNYPYGGCFDVSSNIFIADYQNNKIRKITICTSPSSPTNTTTVLNTQVCVGSTTTLTTIGTGTISWFLNPTGGSALSSGSTFVTSNTLAIGSYTYYAEDYTCTNSLTRTPVTFTVNPTPTITVNSGSICLGSSFTISPFGANTYTYSGGTNVVNPTNNTTFTVTGASSQGCTNTAVSNVTVNALPIVNASTNNTLICSGQTASLTASGATSYTWNTSATTNVIAITPTTTTVYTVTGMDANGCINSASFTQSVGLCTNIQNATLNNTIFNIFPNPNNGSFIIELDSNTIISIYNLLGEIIYSENLLEGKYSIDIQNQPNGVYIVKSNNNNHSFKLIKN